jgi:hypothetical protein
MGGSRRRIDVSLYVLTRLLITGDHIGPRNVGVTFSLDEAQKHAAKDVANGFEMHQVDAKSQEDVETSNLLIALREFREVVQAQIEEALR